MDFIDELRVLSARIKTIKDMIQTEEATKNAMVMPLIQILGYNPFDPLEVTPELVADVGTKKGEKVDYAILKDAKPIIIFECKKSGAELNISHAGQLFRYFHVTEAKFGVLTNGLVYKFSQILSSQTRWMRSHFLNSISWNSRIGTLKSSGNSPNRLITWTLFSRQLMISNIFVQSSKNWRNGFQIHPKILSGLLQQSCSEQDVSRQRLKISSPLSPSVRSSN